MLYQDRLCHYCAFVVTCAQQGAVEGDICGVGKCTKIKRTEMGWSDMMREINIREGESERSKRVKTQKSGHLAMKQLTILWVVLT